MTTAEEAPSPGRIARVRQRLYLVEATTPPPRAEDCTLVRLSCVDDDAQGQPLEVLWEKEVDAEVKQGEDWDAIAKRGFDQREVFAAYRTLDVEQIGSVYETIMGFELEVAKGRSIAIKPAKSHGAPATINLEELLTCKAGDRAKWLAERTDQKMTGQAAEALKKAATIDELLAALEKKIADNVTPNAVPRGAMIFQPSDERRRSGSHYTPRSLTEPIVRKTLAPVLKNLGDSPTPQQILDLKICDLAMGSAAFLVETCRQLGDVLVKAWHVHNQVPRIPLDEDEILHARRLVAQRCLYGVDKNAMAVDLAKLSLWLATLAKDHPFTFLDHALRHGDSLVGLTRKQITDFHWLPEPQRIFGQDVVEKRIKAATQVRQEIIEAGDEVPFLLKQQKLALADESLNLVRFAGNLVIAAYFAGDNDKTRKLKREELLQQFSESLRTGIRPPEVSKVEHDLRSGNNAIHPFHWEIEFPEVFARGNPGFDAIVGNPPFLGGTLIGGRLGLAYHDYLVEGFSPATGLADVIAFFLRQSFAILRCEGALGLIATNTVAQGDTRNAGLEPIVRKGGAIFHTQRRYEWPGEAAVVVSVIHIAKTQIPLQPMLDGMFVDRISSFLLKGNADDLPVAMCDNKGICYRGAEPWGAGFLFEDEPSDGSSSVAEMKQLLLQEPRNQEVIFPYMGGKEFNASPTQSPSRFIIDFARMPESEARQWPLLFAILEERVRPVRAGNKQRNYREEWWLHANRAPEAAVYSKRHGHLMALASVSRHLSVAFARPGIVLANSMHLVLLHEYADFSILQCRIHETWARFLGSSMKDDLRYSTPCFDTFPRPAGTDRTAMNTVGTDYYEFRAKVMKESAEGLTKIYNRFHDPNETSAEIKKLRELHAAMDRAVLAAYGWTDLQPTCEFLLDYDEEDDDEDDAGKARKKKKPWRYRWPDDFRDLVLARLLELNKQRAEQEALAGASAAEKPKKVARRGRKKQQDDSGDSRLF